MVKVRTEKVIDVDDWDKLVIKTYKKPYNFQQQDDCQERQRVPLTVPDNCVGFVNDTVPEIVNDPEMGVSFSAWLARDPKQLLSGEPDCSSWDIDLWWHRNFYPDVQEIANDLHARGLLEAGEYVIDIDW